MKNVIGGLIAIILGIFSFTIFFPSFLNFLAGIIPLSLILGGGLIIYFKHGEGATDHWDNNISDASSPEVPTQTAPAEAKPVETEPVETEAVETEAVETEAVETEAVETEAVETEAVETEAVETEAVETEAVEKVTENPTGEIPQFLGNTDSRVFHNSGCQYSKSKKCTAVFNTREEALGEGYKPCGTCKP